MTRFTVVRVGGPVVGGPFQGKVQYEVVEFLDGFGPSPAVRPWRGRIRVFYHGRVVEEREANPEDFIETAW